MKGTIVITVPKDRYSPIDYFLEQADKLGEIKGIKITFSSYERMKMDPYIYQDVSYSGEYEKWIGEETTIEGKYYPPLMYLLKLDDGGAFVKSIEYGERVFEFELESHNLEIDY